MIFIEHKETSRELFVVYRSSNLIKSNTRNICAISHRYIPRSAIHTLARESIQTRRKHLCIGLATK